MPSSAILRKSIAQEWSACIREWLFVFGIFIRNAPGSEASVLDRLKPTLEVPDEAYSVGSTVEIRALRDGEDT